MLDSQVATTIALIVVLSFALDRMVAGLLFLLSFNRQWSRKFPDPTLVEGRAERIAAERKHKLIYSVFAALLGIAGLAWFGHVRILSTLGVTPHAWPFATGRDLVDLAFLLSFRLLDILITGLILTAGADRVAHLMKWFGGKGDVGFDPPGSRPIEIAGTLTLEGSKGTILASEIAAAHKETEKEGTAG